LEATDLARTAVESGADLILVLGGDGTINEVVNGMAHSQVPLAVLPGGTANVTAMELGLSSNLERAAQRLGECKARRIALGRLSGPAGEQRYFLLMGGVGLDADIVLKVNSDLKARTGKFAYYVAGFRQFLSSVGQFEACLNGSKHRCGFVLASRVRNYGGDLEIASGASLLQDEFEVVAFEGKYSLRYAAYMTAVAVRSVQKLPGVHTYRTSRVELSGHAPIQLDGEYSGRSPAVLETVPDALTLLIPDSYR
jgi:YegS/Rv2252/BmrU family lipid kinase